MQPTGHHWFVCNDSAQYRILPGVRFGKAWVRGVSALVALVTTLAGASTVSLVFLPISAFLETCFCMAKHIADGKRLACL